MMLRAALLVGLGAANLLACADDSAGGLGAGGGVSVLGVVEYWPRPGSPPDSPPSCSESGRVLPVPVLIDTTLWTDFELPLWVRNGGPAQAEGPRRFDESITPTGLARTSWECLGAPFNPNTAQPAPAGSNLDGGWAEGGLGDAGSGEGMERPDAPDASYLPYEWNEDLPLPELVLQRRDPETPFCRSWYQVPRDDPPAQRATAGGRTILGGDEGLVVLRAVTRELVQDMDLELRLGELAVRCCAESGAARCEGPLSGAACETLRQELRTLTTTRAPELEPDPEETFEPLIHTLATRPSILWVGLRASLELMNPYGARRDALGRIRVGFCRGCGGRWPPAEGPSPSPRMTCIAQKPWGSP